MHEIQPFQHPAEAKDHYTIGDGVEHNFKFSSADELEEFVTKVPARTVF
jgi:hypothetical protein